MSALRKLTTSSKSKADAKEPDQQRLRRLLRDNLTEQGEIIEAELRGEQLIKLKTIYVLNKLTGEIQQQQVSRQLRRWFWENPDGTACLQLLYWNIPLTLRGDDTTIEVKTLAELPAAIELVIKAIDGGELDGALIDAMERRKEKMRGIKNTS